MIEVLGIAVRRGAFTLEIEELRVERGEILAVMGPNGAGKTTLLETLAGFIKPERGRILLGGLDVTRLPPEARGVGYVPQDLLLFPHMTVWENVALKLRRREDLARAREACSLLGLDGLLSRKAGELSGGQRQRVALARALVRAERALLLDEPLSSIDAESRERVASETESVLRAWVERSRVPTIYVSHDSSEVEKLADRVVLLRGGQDSRRADELTRLGIKSLLVSSSLPRGFESRLS
ncbi:MAG: ATP-binding cassette domain-containing protein [Fervidicoccaceae archaeon]